MLKLNGVSYSERKKSADIVRNVTMEVREADYIVISGQNDEERRALLDILGIVKSPKSGEVYIDGIELSKHTPNQLTILRRGTFGYFLADSELDPALTVGENVSLPLVFAGLGADEIKAKEERALNIVGLAGFRNLKINNLTEWQRNKALLARAIVGEPRVLILSEPCRVQDDVRLNEVLGLLSALNRDGVCVIVESNNSEYVVKARRRIEISGGAIVELKKERAPRETTKKTKKTSKAKSKQEKVEEIITKPVEVEEKQLKTEEPKVVEEPKKVEKEKRTKTSTKKIAVKDVVQEKVEETKNAENSKKTAKEKLEVKVETKKTTKTKANEEKVVEEKPKKTKKSNDVVEEIKPQESLKKVGRPKKQVEEKSSETPKATTRKKKGETVDATSKN